MLPATICTNTEGCLLGGTNSSAELIYLKHPGTECYHTLMRLFGPVDVFIFLPNLKEKDAVVASVISVFPIGPLVHGLM